jgi:hypothetical protein
VKVVPGPAVTNITSSLIVPLPTTIVKGKVVGYPVRLATVRDVDPVPIAAVKVVAGAVDE